MFTSMQIKMMAWSLVSIGTFFGCLVLALYLVQTINLCYGMTSGERMRQ